MKDNPQLQQDDLPIWFALKYKFKRLHVSDTSCRPSTICPRYQDDPHENAHPKGENSAKRKKMSEHGTYVFGESSSSQENESEPGPSTSCNQEQLDDFDFWTCGISYIITRGRFLDLASFLERETLEREYLRERKSVFL
ncbi:hypothetical protein Tco_0341718 [Tanacetum coccineum]